MMVTQLNGSGVQTQLSNSGHKKEVLVSVPVAAVTVHGSALKRGVKGDTHVCGLSGQIEGWKQRDDANKVCYVVRKDPA